MNSLPQRAAALVFAFAVTLATLAGLDSLARSDNAALLAQAAAASSPRG